jgi:Stigma-specific protein, Stig1
VNRLIQCALMMLVASCVENSLLLACLNDAGMDVTRCEVGVDRTAPDIVADLARDQQSDVGAQDMGVVSRDVPLRDACSSTSSTCDGVCVDTNTDPRNCGGCGVRCMGTQACCRAVCANTTDDCGTCGNRCPPPAGGTHAAAACPAGVCSFVCETGFGDCDGIRTNGCETALGPCTVGQGACSRSGTFQCGMTPGAPRCSAVAGASASETCNGVDDDCNGVVDNDVTRDCYSGPTNTVGVGACRSGTQTCVAGGAGTWSACVGEVVPSIETVCDGVDDDCNRIVDDPFTGTLSTCRSELNLARRTDAIPSVSWAFSGGDACYQASLAVDGDVRGNYYFCQVAVASPRTVPSWTPASWSIDLRDRFQVNRVVVWGRTLDYLEQSLNFVVETSLDLSRWSPAPSGAVTAMVAATEGGVSGRNAVVYFSGVVARYVRLRRTTDGFLSLAEVQIFGCPPPLGLSCFDCGVTVGRNVCSSDGTNTRCSNCP